MKKLIFVLLVMTMIFTLCSCSRENEQQLDGIESDEITQAVTEFLKSNDLVYSEKNESVSQDTTPINELYELPYQEDLTPYIDITRDDYFGIALTLSEAKEVTAEDMVEAINDDLKENGKYSAVTERGAVLGDIVEIDFKGTVDGEAFDGGTAEDYELELGSGSFIDGFEDALVGHKVGESFTVTVTFPEDYRNEELRGKEADFEVTMNYITEIIPCTFGEQFATEVFFCATLNDYLKQVYLELCEYNAQKAESENKNNAYTAVFEAAKIKEYPEDKYNEYRDGIIAQYDEIASSIGVETEVFITSYLNSTMDYFYEYADSQAKNIIEQELIAFSIANSEKLWQGLTKGDYDTYVKELAESYGMDVEEFEAENDPSDIWKSLILEAVIQFVIDNSVR